MKKLISIILTTIIVFSAMPFVYAAEVEYNSEFCTAAVVKLGKGINSAKELCRLSGQTFYPVACILDSEAVLPAGYLVTIGDYTFSGNNLRSTQSPEIYIVSRECNAYHLREAYLRGYITESDLNTIAEAAAQSVDDITGRKEIKVEKTGDRIAEKRKATLTKNGYHVYDPRIVTTVNGYDLCYDYADPYDYDDLDNLPTMRRETIVVGNFVFDDVLARKSYTPALYLVNDSKAYNFEQAYKNGIFSDNDMNWLYGVISMLCPGYKQVLAADNKLFQNYITRFYGENRLTKYNRLDSSDNLLLVRAECGLTNKKYVAHIGNYIVSTSMVTEPYPFGLYVIDGENVYTLEAAYKTGVLSREKLESYIEKGYLNAREATRADTFFLEYLEKHKLFDDSYYSFYSVGNVGDYKLYVGHTNNGRLYSAAINGVKVSMPDKYGAEPGMELFLVDNYNLYTLREACSLGKVKIEDVADVYEKHGNGMFTFEREINLRDSFLAALRMKGKGYNKVADDDIVIDTMKDLGGCYLVQFHVKSWAYTDLLYIYRINKYIYSCGSPEKAYIFTPGNPPVELPDAWNTGMINKAQLNAVVKALPESFKINTVKLKPGRGIAANTLFAMGKFTDLEKLTISDANILKKNKDNTLTTLQKGTAEVTVKLKNMPELKVKVKVSADPALWRKAVTVKKNSTATVKLSGKAKSIANKYTSTAKAKIISGKNASTIKIKGVKKGASTVKIKVNGVVTLKLKVKVV